MLELPRKCWICINMKWKRSKAISQGQTGQVWKVFLLLPQETTPFVISDPDERKWGVILDCILQSPGNRSKRCEVRIVDGLDWIHFFKFRKFGNDLSGCKIHDFAKELRVSFGSVYVVASFWKVSQIRNTFRFSTC